MCTTSYSAYLMKPLQLNLEINQELQGQLDDKAWRPWGIPTQECVYVH